MSYRWSVGAAQTSATVSREFTYYETVRQGSAEADIYERPHPSGIGYEYEIRPGGWASRYCGASEDTAGSLNEPRSKARSMVDH